MEIITLSSVLQLMQFYAVTQFYLNYPRNEIVIIFICCSIQWCCSCIRCSKPGIMDQDGQSAQCHHYSITGKTVWVFTAAVKQQLMLQKTPQSQVKAVICTSPFLQMGRSEGISRQEEQGAECGGSGHESLVPGVPAGSQPDVPQSNCPPPSWVKGGQEDIFQTVVTFLAHGPFPDSVQ